MPEKKIDDGGPVYPQPMSKTVQTLANSMKIERISFEGISIRMWLAGQGMAAFVNALASTDQKPERDVERYVARIALRFADALIKESHANDPGST